MAAAFLPSRILFLVIVSILKFRWIYCELSCDTHDLKTTIIHIRKLRTEFQDFKDDTARKLNELENSQKESLVTISDLTKQLEVLKNNTRTVGCPDTWVSYDNSCYYFGETVMTFSQAQSFCREQMSHLAHVNDSAENDFLKDHMRSFYNGSNFWLGLTDEATEGEWRWTETNKVVEFEDWAPDEPNNYEQNEHCCHFVSDYDFKWNDVHCSEAGTTAAFCEKGMENKVTSIVNMAGVTRKGALEHCEQCRTRSAAASLMRTLVGSFIVCSCI